MTRLRGFPSLGVSYLAYGEHKTCIMKKVIIIITMLAGFVLHHPASAQTSVSVNIGLQPMWGPVGYSYVEYYYLPAAEVYYWVPGRQFVYWNGFEWVFVSYLPARYHVDLYTTYKVVINEPKPWIRHKVYVVKYKRYKSSPPKQVIIRDSNDPKYNVVKGHTQNKGDDHAVKKQTEKKNVVKSKKEKVVKKKKKGDG